MPRGSCLPGPPSHLRATLTACRSGSPSRVGDRWRGRFNASFAQRQLHAGGRNWFEGRIAECPRLQQKPSEPLITERAVIADYSSPVRGVRRMVSPHDAQAGAPRDRRRAAEHLPGTDSQCWDAASAKRVVHWCLTTSRPPRSAVLAEKPANPPLFFSARLA